MLFAEPLDTLIIRDAVAGDVPQIASVLTAAFDQFHDRLLPAVFTAYMADLRTSAGDGHTIVADLKGRIVGAISYYPDPSTEALGLAGEWAALRRLAVHPSVRGSGLGLKLVRAGVEIARNARMPAIAVHVPSFMTAACHVYEQAGFHRCPNLDLPVYEWLGIDDAGGEIAVVAYWLDIARDPALLPWSIPGILLGEA
jgi:predicted N-acetyltransferase YhbS